MKINPNQIPIFSNLMFSLLKYLENEGSQNGFILYDKGKIYSNTIFFDETPRKGDRTYIDIKFSMERPTTGELKQRINMFLEGLTH